MSKLVERYKKSEFLKNVMVVMSGTAVSQIIALSLTPVLTRNYTPQDFGYYTTFIAIYAILCSFATGKYERVILLLKEEQEIVNVSTLGITISVIVSILLFLIISTALLFGISIPNTTPLFNSWLYALPVLLIIYAINLVFFTFLNYKKEFKEISKSRIIKTIVSISVSLICIFFLKNMGGLILGELIGLFVSTVYLYPRLKFLFSFKKKVISTFSNYARKYRSFPLYNIPSDLLSNSSAQMPAFFLTPVFGPQITGQYSLMKRVLDAPVTLLSSSILEVFRQKASEQYIKDGNCRVLFVKTAKTLILISFLPFTILILFAPTLFTFIFGDAWVEAGKFASIFSIFYFFKFVSSPLSYMFYIAEKQKVDFLLHLYVFFSSLLIFYIPSYYQISITQIMWCYSINFVFIYSVYFAFSLKYSVK